jgi:hypothetical protein
MRRRRLWPALALAGVIAVPAPGQAADAGDVLRPCRRADLIGFWRVIRFGFATGASVDRSAPTYRMHQRYAFNANATMAYSAWEAPPTPEEQRAMLLTPAATTWALDAEGRLRRSEPGATRTETSECRVLIQAVRDPRSQVPAMPGDVLLTDQGADERPVARRLLRRLEPEE